MPHIAALLLIMGQVCFLSFGANLPSLSSLRSPYLRRRSVPLTRSPALPFCPVLPPSLRLEVSPLNTTTGMAGVWGRAPAEIELGAF